MGPSTSFSNQRTQAAAPPHFLIKTPSKTKKDGVMAVNERPTKIKRICSCGIGRIGVALI